MKYFEYAARKLTILKKRDAKLAAAKINRFLKREVYPMYLPPSYPISFSQQVSIRQRLP